MDLCCVSIEYMQETYGTDSSAALVSLYLILKPDTSPLTDKTSNLGNPFTSAPLSNRTAIGAVELPVDMMVLFEPWIVLPGCQTYSVTSFCPAPVD